MQPKRLETRQRMVVEIDRDLIRQAKMIAASQERPLWQVIEAALKLYLTTTQANPDDL